LDIQQIWRRNSRGLYPTLLASVRDRTEKKNEIIRQEEVSVVFLVASLCSKTVVVNLK
jgi:hypothetical protein